MSTDIKRISPDEGVALFERTGLVPTPGLYLEISCDGACGCLVGALAVDASGLAATKRIMGECGDSLLLHVVSQGFDHLYVRGLMCGFDDPLNTDEIDLESRAQDWQIGFADGAAIRQRVLPVATEG